MIKQNKLSLKSLQEQLDQIKNNKNKKVEDTRSSSLLLWYPLSWALLFINKLPIFSKFHKLLKLYYGRTSIWKLLIYIRKIFIIINAVIGVYAVFNITGFTTENLLAGFVGMGHNYIDIISSFTKRLFNWFFDLLDYKVIPNIPKDKPNITWWPGPRSHTWYTKPMVDTNLMDVLNKDFPSTLSNGNVSSTSYFKDWSTILYLVGSVTLAMSVLGLGFMAYSYFTATLPTYNIEGTDGNPPTFPPTGDNTDSTLSQINNSLSALYSNTRKALNPWNWMVYVKDAILPDNSLAESIFKGKQNELVSYDNRFYPFTNIDPFKPWYHRIRISMFGESELEIIQRMKDRNFALREAIALLDKRIPSGIVTSGIKTPSMLGLGFQLDPSLYPNWADTLRTTEILSRLPRTPVDLPSFANEWLQGPSGSKSPGVTTGTLSQSHPKLTLDTILESSKEWSKSNSPVSPSPQSSPLLPKPISSSVSIIPSIILNDNKFNILNRDEQI